MTDESKLLISGLPHAIRKIKQIRSVTDLMIASGVAECFDRRGDIIERMLVASSHRKVVDLVGHVSRERAERWVDRGIDAALKKYGNGRKINREVFYRRRELCHQCEYHTNGCKDKGSSDGCTLLKKPCGVELLWMSNKKDWCPAGYDIPASDVRIDSFDATIRQQDKIAQLVAVTSLSRNEYHKSRQHVALRTWKAFGLDVVSVNAADEIEQMRSVYHEVDEWIPSVPYDSLYEKKTQQVSQIIKVAEALEKTVLLVNSDIEIYGDQKDLLNKLEAEKTLVGGIRYNYSDPASGAEREKWGIDCFVITPKMSRSIENIGLEIGRPVWDYWVPLHFMQLGYRVDLIGKPLFFHERHDVLWTKSDWQIGSDCVEKAYGTDKLKLGHSLSFRRSLPFAATR